MICVGHRRKKIQVKLVKSGPLIDNIIIMMMMMMMIMMMITIITITITIIIIIIIIITIMIIIITHLNKSRLTSDFKFQLLISAPHSVNCLAIIIPTTDMWPP